MSKLAWFLLINIRRGGRERVLYELSNINIKSKNRAKN